MIFLLDLGTVPSVWYFLFLILLIFQVRKMKVNTLKDLMFVISNKKIPF
jgi:hypothetical protein